MIEWFKSNNTADQIGKGVFYKLQNLSCFKLDSPMLLKREKWLTPCRLKYCTLTILKKLIYKEI